MEFLSLSSLATLPVEYAVSKALPTRAEISETRNGTAEIEVFGTRSSPGEIGWETSCDPFRIAANSDRGELTSNEEDLTSLSGTRHKSFIFRPDNPRNHEHGRPLLP